MMLHHYSACTIFPCYDTLHGLNWNFGTFGGSKIWKAFQYCNCMYTGWGCTFTACESIASCIILSRNLKKGIKVAQLVGSASEISGYHHGEASLAGTIIGLAQNFVGSNNLNLLEPIGTFQFSYIHVLIFCHFFQKMSHLIGNSRSNRAILLQILNYLPLAITP